MALFHVNSFTSVDGFDFIFFVVDLLHMILQRHFVLERLIATRTSVGRRVLLVDLQFVIPTNKMLISLLRGQFAMFKNLYLILVTAEKSLFTNI